MPRISRHRSHRSHRRGGSPDRSESEGEEVAAVAAREEVAAAARVSRDPESERHRSSSGKDYARSGNGYADHGRKRKERVEEAVVDVVSDRWNSGVCEDHMADKRSKGETLGPVDAEKQLDKPKGSGDESKRSSRWVVGSDERVEELVSKSDSAKRRSEREKDSGRRDSTGQYKEDRDRDRDKEKEREKEWERQKEREREKSRDREREKEREREREREREKDRDREREREKQKDRERDKKDYDSKHDRYDDGGSRKSGSKTSRVEVEVEVEVETHLYKRDIEVNEIPAKEKYTHSEKQADKYSRRKDDPEDTDKWVADNRDSDDRKTQSRYEHGKARSSKEQRPDDDKYKDDYGRDKRQQDDKFLDERVTRDNESERADYKSAKDGHRSSEGHYRKDAVQDGDHHDDYSSRYKESRGRKRPPEENDGQYDLKPPSTRDQHVNLEKSSGSGRLDSMIERARPDRSSSPTKLHARSSPSPNSYHDKDQSWHGSKLTDHGKRELPYDERNIRPRASSGRERTPATRLRDRDGENWSSERLKQKDDHHPRDIPSEISASAQYDRTSRKDKHASAKQLSEKSPSCDQRFSGRLSGGRSLDIKGERNSLTKYRDRDGDLSQERSLHQDRTPAKVPFREPTPSGSSINRGGHFSGVLPNHPLPPSVRQRTEDSSFVGSHDDDRRPQSGDRRFHGHQKRNDMNSGRGHGHSWNNPPNWPPPIANGFVPIQHGAPGFHPPVHQFHAPHMFNLRPQMKLNQPGVSYPMHDAHMRPFGWANPLDESCPPHLWNGGNVFPGEHYMYGRQEWDQNRTHTGSRGWEMVGDASKGLNEVPNGELPVAKEPDSTATTISESAGGERNPQPWIEQKETKHLIPESFEAKDGIKSSEFFPGAPLNTSMLSKNGAVFSKSYLSRISVSPVLAESELYNKCISLLGDLVVAKAPQMAKNELVENNGNAGKITNHGTPNTFSSLYLKSNSTIFQRAMALYKNQTGKISALAKTEGKMDLPEATHDTEMLYCAPKGSVVNNLAPHCNVDTMDEGSPSKHESGDDTGAASPTATGSAGVEAPPAISQPDEEMEAVAPHAVTEPDKDIEDVVSPAIEVLADFLDDDAPQATLELASDLQEATPADAMEDVAPSAVGESCHSLEGMPPAVTESSLGKEDASAAASPGSLGIPPSIMHEGADTGMEDDMGKAIAAGNGDVNSSGLAPEFNVPTCDAQDPEALLVESRINLSRIPNSPESTH